jgi:hypothetical protein
MRFATSPRTPTTSSSPSASSPSSTNACSSSASPNTAHATGPPASSTAPPGADVPRSPSTPAASGDPSSSSSPSPPRSRRASNATRTPAKSRSTNDNVRGLSAKPLLPSGVTRASRWSSVGRSHRTTSRRLAIPTSRCRFSDRSERDARGGPNARCSSRASVSDATVDALALRRGCRISRDVVRRV